MGERADNGRAAAGRNGDGRHDREYTVLCMSHLRWNFVWQRPQQLMSRCGRDRPVVFVEEPLAVDGPPRLEVRPREGGVTVVVPRLPIGLEREESARVVERLLVDFLTTNTIDRYVLWYYTPMALAATRALTPDAVVYDCMDELSGFLGAPGDLLQLERELLARADLVFTGGQSLYEAKRTLHPNVRLFPSSVDAPHFATARAPQPDPADQFDIPRPRVGFFGVLDERLDVALIAAIARLRPDWQLVFVGPVVKIDEATLPKAPNIHYLGQKSYAELPAYIAGWDVALLPFARNDATRFISPTKTPEYLAAGRPVVSTSIRDVVRPYGEEGLVLVADEPDDFVAAVEAALREDDPTERLHRVDSFLTEFSWDYTWADMSELVDEAVRGLHRQHRRDGHAASPPAFDWLVVGAGFAGSVLAERLAGQLGQRVLVVDRRPHIGGNAYDHYDDAGLLVHRYGPHIFHTNSSRVFAYLSQFTEWRQYQHRVLASVDGQLVPFPINVDTVNALYGVGLTALDFDDFLASVAEMREPLQTMEDAVVARVGRDLYSKFFRNYTRKQWNLDPSELDAGLAARVPTRSSRDARYFTDVHQAMPRHGFTRMFERMLSRPGIKVLLNADYREVAGLFPYDRVVYTGPIDEFFDFELGKLPYRSLEFRFETVDAPVAQPAAVINYPNEYDYTRVTEFKYLTGQEHPRTTLVYEYPRADGDPYYPVPQSENAAVYKRYKELADATPGVEFVGRLATYKYYNMDQVVAQALATFERIAPRRDAPGVARAASAVRAGR